MDQRGLDTGEIGEIRTLSGGTQNILIRFTRDDSEYILRRPPAMLRPNSNDTMRREARVLAALAGSSVPHPRLIASCPEEDVLGAAFYLMEPVEGFNAAAGLPQLHAGSAVVRKRMGLAMVEGIAAVGAIDIVESGLEGFGKPDKFLERQVKRWKAQLESYAGFDGWTGPEAIPGVDKIGRWLEAHRPSTFSPGLIHGDFHLANVMFGYDDGEVAAIVDWELSTIGDPLLDLGWLLATWPEGGRWIGGDSAIEPWDGFATTGELTDHYAAVSGRDITALEWYVVLAAFKLGIILEGTHARACAGKAPRETGDHLHAQAIHLFQRALERIT
jgi:aminoglycoside phosphotransferase (APT) family kinase protein